MDFAITKLEQEKQNEIAVHPRRCRADEQKLGQRGRFLTVPWREWGRGGGEGGREEGVHAQEPWTLMSPNKATGTLKGDELVIG